MAEIKQSIFFSSIRAFCVSAFSVIGFGFAFILIFAVFEGISDKGGEGKVKSRTHLELLPNGKGERKDLGKSAPVILRIDIAGTIGSEKLNYDIVEQQLIESRENELKGNRVKGIMLYIQSPGGTFVDSDSIYRLIKDYKEQYNVPVYAHVDGLCASGAVYIACAADKINTSHSSLFGSVGVIIPSFINFSGAMEKLGVESKTLSIGKGKDAMNPVRPWVEGEEDNYRLILDYLYDSFIDVVVSNRPKMEKDTLKIDIGAKMLPAEKALDYGLVDAINYRIPDTLTELSRACGIENDDYRVVRMKSRSWISDLFEAYAPFGAMTVNHKIQMPHEVEGSYKSQALHLKQQF